MHFLGLKKFQYCNILIFLDTDNYHFTNYCRKKKDLRM